MRPAASAAVHAPWCPNSRPLHPGDFRPHHPRSARHHVSTVGPPGARRLLADLARQPGDTLTVVKLDRLGRSTRDVLNLVHELEGRGAHLRVLEPEISTTGPMGKMVLTVLGMVAEMELGVIRERQRVGIEAAKAKGIYEGRPVTLDHPRIRAMRAQGKGATEIARNATLYSDEL
ncbi:MAG: recombinase family protein [bacterium]